MRLLAVTAVPAEADALAGDLGGAAACRVGTHPGRRYVTAAGTLDVVVAGAGPVAAAAASAAALAGSAYDAALSLGVAGGFAGRAAPGEVVVAAEVYAADLGAESPDGFLPLEALGLGPSVLALDPDAARLPDRLAAAGLTVRVGRVVTVATVTGTDAAARRLADRLDPLAEAMEGYAVAWAAHAAGVPAYEVRAVSNAVGRRDRAAWDLPGALDALARAGAALFGQAWP